jgi:hypothetical protein
VYIYCNSVYIQITMNNMSTVCVVGNVTVTNCLCDLDLIHCRTELFVSLLFMGLFCACFSYVICFKRLGIRRELVVSTRMTTPNELIPQNMYEQPPPYELKGATHSQVKQQQLALPPPYQEI